MNIPEVRIVQLEPSRVACFNGFGQIPETIAWGKLQAWARSKGLWEDGKARRLFGFNNPNPSCGTPNYGYEAWMAIDKTVQVDGEARPYDFPGGLYAVLRCEVKDAYQDIPASWKQLVIWQENSEYEKASHQCLEELLSPLGDGSEFVLDLFLPISK